MRTARPPPWPPPPPPLSPWTIDSASSSPWSPLRQPLSWLPSRLMRSVVVLLVAAAATALGPPQSELGGGGSTPTPHVNWRSRGEVGERRRPVLSPPRGEHEVMSGGDATAGAGEASTPYRAVARWGGHDGMPPPLLTAPAVPSGCLSEVTSPEVTSADTFTATTAPAAATCFMPFSWRTFAAATGSGTPPPTDEKDAVYEEVRVQLHVEHRLRSSSSSRWSSPHLPPPPGGRGGRPATAVASALRPRPTSRGGGGGGSGDTGATATATAEGAAASETGERGHERRGKGEGGGRPPRGSPPSPRLPPMVWKGGKGEGSRAGTDVGCGRWRLSASVVPLGHELGIEPRGLKKGAVPAKTPREPPEELETAHTSWRAESPTCHGPVHPLLRRVTRSR